MFRESLGTRGAGVAEKRDLVRARRDCKPLSWYLEVMTSYLAGTDEFADVKARTLKSLPTGFALWLWPNRNDRSNNIADSVAYLLRTEYQVLANQVCAFLDNLSSTDHKHVFRSPTIGAMFATFGADKEASNEFWQAVCSGAGFTSAHDPRLRLRDELLNSNIAVGGRGGALKGGKKNVDQEYMLRICLMAWNAFREDREVHVLRPNRSAHRPVVK